MPKDNLFKFSKEEIGVAAKIERLQRLYFEDYIDNTKEERTLESVFNRGFEACMELWKTFKSQAKWQHFLTSLKNSEE